MNWEKKIHANMYVDAHWLSKFCEWEIRRCVDMDSMERSMNHHINKNASGIGESFPIFLYRVEALNLFFLDFNLKENPLNQTSKTQTQRVNI